MQSTIEYSAHFKPITFLPFSNNSIEPIQSCNASEESDKNPNWLAYSHQQFILSQQQAFEYFLQHQLYLWGKIHSYPTTNEEKSYPAFSRKDLEELASGKISNHFGAWFEPLDQYERLVRMPEPPLLLADRVTKIDAEAGSCKTGTIWTETDVQEDSWYLHHGRMPAGIMIESGQADLLLASWLGFDLYNKGERIYRLLGCELSYYGELPKPGDTLCYDIHITHQARQGDIRLFFFHYDCKVNGELRLKVRNGQAGFFSDQELAESGGVLWDAAAESCDVTLTLDSPSVMPNYAAYSQSQIQQFAAGNIVECFGPGFELTQSHTRTPRISDGKMLFLDEISQLDVQGGPWKRGYARAVQRITPDNWFFKGHFKNDPCMPGTLMLEAGLQVMAFYLTSLGYTIDKDGWRFEPVIEKTYQLRCRGQVRPTSQEVVYEIFVTSVVAGPIPMLFADLLGTVDGLKAFHTKIGLRLVPDWPLAQAKLPHADASRAASVDGFTFDYASLLACATGKPSDAFGPIYHVFDSHRRVPRLPAPPYHFISRVTDIQGDIGSVKMGAEIVCEYDVPPDAWYFSSNHGVMPYCVLLEAALQPCGWLASYLGCALSANEEVVFRNLDGAGTVLKDVLPNSGKIITKVKCNNLFRSAGSIITVFEVQSFIDGEKIYHMDTVFGFFPLTAFENQVGLPIPENEIDLLNKQSNFHVDLTLKPTAFFSHQIAMADQTLLMIDRVTGYWPGEGKKQIGQLRAEKTVNPSEWFFKAHFFQDPVQPGSLGIEAMSQLLQFYMLQQGMHTTMQKPVFESLALTTPLTWKYRGQVVPTNGTINILLDITEIREEKDSVCVIADASLWVDGKRIYEAKQLGMRLNDQRKN